MSGPLGADSRVGDYVIEAEIGRGGMGVVYRARQARLERAVALKVIAPNLAHDPTFRGRFDRESRLAASIEHPNAVPVYEAGEADGVVFIAMRLIEGTDLRALLRKESWLEAERAATLIDQVAGALDAAHGRGLVHRDVKPGNVLIGNAGGREWAYLTDFGLTKRLAGATELTESGKWMGTADYASPEQIQGKELDARSDVYSLGCVLYEALTGRIPFEREEPVAKLYAHVNDPPPTVSEVLPEPAPSLDAVIARALAKKPSDRFPSAGDLGRAALAASRGDQATVPERSVARGEAAPESQTGMRAALTRPIAGLTTRIGRDAEERPGWVLPVASLATLVLLAVIVWAAFSVFGGGEEGGAEVIGTTEVGERPLSVAVGDGFAWVTNENDGTVSRIDTATGEVAGDPIPVGDEPSNIRVGAGSVWVANAGSNTVSRIDPETNRTEQTIRVGERPTGRPRGRGVGLGLQHGRGDRLAHRPGERQGDRHDPGGQPACRRRHRRGGRLGRQLGRRNGFAHLRQIRRGRRQSDRGRRPAARHRGRLRLGLGHELLRRHGLARQHRDGKPRGADPGRRSARPGDARGGRHVGREPDQQHRLPDRPGHERGGEGDFGRRRAARDRRRRRPRLGRQFRGRHRQPHRALTTTRRR